MQPTFGALLRRYRLAAGISQERLAEQAGLSVQALSALENGRRQAPYRHTVALLAQALGLSADQTALLEASIVRGRMPAAVAPAAGRQDQETPPQPQSAGDAAPRVPAAQAARTNLPLALTSFIGREGELAAVQALLGTARLVTLTGAGGAGKTRLALAVAGMLLSEYPDGVWLVELASLADPALVVQAVAQALGLREEPNRPLLVTLVDHLKERSLLLVLDNCEHLVAACAELVAALLRAWPHVRILATSRETLAVPGETTYRVPSLAAPDLMHLPDPEQLPAYAAVELFVQRAPSRRPEFTLSMQNAHAVAEVCVRLDGIPLAVELAAARVASLPVDTIAARLDDRFRLLTGGPRTAVTRQQTLRAAMDWSWELLTAPEQVLLRRLSVFAGGWALEAAEDVCAGGRIESLEILDLLAGLVNKSLVLLEEAGADVGYRRYRLLETVRQHSWEHLQASGEEVAVRDQHLVWCVALAVEAVQHLTGPEQIPWFDRLETEHANLRAALGWALERRAPEGLRLAGALWRFWARRGQYTEGRNWLEKALAGGQGLPAVRIMALNGAGLLAYLQSDFGRAVALFDNALALGRALGDKEGIAASLNCLGNVASIQSEYGRAATLYEESLMLRRELGDMQGIAGSLGNLGMVAYMQDKDGRAAALLEEALALQRALGDPLYIGTSLHNLGLVAYQQGDHGRAAALLEEVLALKRDLGDTVSIALALHNLGLVAYAQGDYGQAAALIGEGLALRRELGDRRGIADSLDSLARVAHVQGDHRRAAALIDEALALQRTAGDGWGIANSFTNLARAAYYA
jgi:non-specific serine/threonine protein kinase